MTNTKMIKNAVWFSRHTPTPDQVEDASRMGYALSVTPVTPSGVALGSVAIQDEDTAEAVSKELKALCRSEGASAIFGVFPTPILGFMFDNMLDITQRGDFQGSDIPCFGSWNVTRSQEGGPATFQHKCFKQVGVL